MFKFLKIENFFLIIVIILSIIYFYLGNNFWDFFLIPVGNYSVNFTDLRCVQSWSRLYENYSNSFVVYNDIQGCRLNYPKIWIPLVKFLFKQDYTVFYLIFCFVLYNFIFYYFLKKYKSIFVVYIYFSGVSFLLLERGNIEILIFIFLFFSLIQNNILKLFLLFLSIILKVFPIFALPSLLTKKNIKYLFYSFIFLLIYFLFTFEDLKFIFQNTPSTGDISYGTKAITSNFQKHFNININNYILSIFLSFLVFFLYLSFFKKKLTNISYINKEMFLSGGSIFSATFLLGSNHDYRMIFIIFLIPLIVNLNLKIYKYVFFITIILSFEVHRLIYFFGFYGGVINSLAKVILFLLTSIFLLDIIKKNIVDTIK